MHVEGENGYRVARGFMHMLMPSHDTRRSSSTGTRRSRCSSVIRYGTQIDAIHSPVCQLQSGGSIVIDQTEALVAIDVNSGNFRVENDAEGPPTR